MMNELTIGEVARRGHMRTSTLRYYEQVGLLPPPKRVNKQRRYTPDVLQRLVLIKVAQQVGFTIAEMTLLLDGIKANEPLSTSWNRQARKKLVEIDAHIQRLLGVKQLLEAGLHCECVQLDECMLYVSGEE